MQNLINAEMQNLIKTILKFTKTYDKIKSVI